MDRREFLITSGGAAVAATSTAAAASEAAPAPSPTAHGSDAAILRLSMAWADTPQGPADSVRRLARRFETLTGGRYRVEISAGGAEDSPDADLLHGSAHDFLGHHTAFAYFAGLPGGAGLAAQDLAHWIAVGGGQMLWDDLAGRQGWKPLLAGHSGEAPPLWSRSPITSLRDLAGQRVAAPGLGLDVARALGAEAHVIHPDTVTQGLADGSIFAAEAGGLLSSLAGGAARAAGHATGDGFNRHGTAYALSVRLGVWEGMDEADRASLAAAAAEEMQLSLAEARAHASLARRVLETSLGTAFAPWPTDVAEAIERVAEATVAHVAGQDPIAARIDQSYMAFRAAVSGVPRTRRSPRLA